ncbi:HEAT repeat domain-containing protein [bacterium]|nr:HEAT repeat domain-containing protein [bacterium]
MLSRKRRIILIIFLVICAFIYVQEGIRQYNGDVKAPWLLKQAVEIVLLATPESTNHLNHFQLNKSPRHKHLHCIFQNTSTKTVIPFLSHRCVDVRLATHSVLNKRREDAMPVIKQAYERGSARIKLELSNYVAEPQPFKDRICRDNPQASIQDQMELLQQIIENRKLRIFQSDSQYIRRFRDKYRHDHSSDELIDIDYPVDIVKFYLKMMNTNIMYEKAYAVGQLGLLGDRSVDAVPALISVLKRKDINRDVPGSSISRNKNYSLHDTVITALGNIGPSATDAIPILEKKLLNSNHFDEINIRSSLYMIDNEKKEHLAFLIKELNSQLPDYNSFFIMNRLNRIGSSAYEAIPRLIELAKNDDELIRQDAREAIQSIEGSNEALISIFGEMLNNKNPRYREKAIEEMTRYCDYPEIKSMLFESLDDIDPDVKYLAVRRIFANEPENELILPALIEIINADQPATKAQNAIDMLRNFPNSDSSDALPGLYKLLNRNSNMNITGIAEMILTLGGDYDVVVKRLLEVLIQADRTRRIPIINMLGKLKPVPDKSLPVLHQIYTRFAGGILRHIPSRQ